jgi:hypothetical protein
MLLRFFMAREHSGVFSSATGKSLIAGSLNFLVCVSISSCSFLDLVWSGIVIDSSSISTSILGLIENKGVAFLIREYPLLCLMVLGILLSKDILLFLKETPRSSKSKSLYTLKECTLLFFLAT